MRMGVKLMMYVNIHCKYGQIFRTFNETSTRNIFSAWKFYKILYLIYVITCLSILKQSKYIYVYNYI